MQCSSIRRLTVTCLFFMLALAGSPGFADQPETSVEPITVDVAPQLYHGSGHGGFWFGSSDYRSPGLAAVLSLTPMPVDFGNLYAENFGWGMAYTAVELSLATPLVWLGAQHMCGGHSRYDDGCDEWSDTEKTWALGLVSGYVGVKLLSAVHAGYAARAYNERHEQDERSSLSVLPLRDGFGLGWLVQY
jgi:hypothetical protein